MAYRKAGPSDIDTFKENIEANVKHCIAKVELLNDEVAERFVLNVCQHYEDNGWLSQAQLQYLVPYWQDINKQL